MECCQTTERGERPDGPRDAQHPGAGARRPLIRAATPPDLPRILELLGAAGLPEQGVGECLDSFQLGIVEGVVVGCAAVEARGHHGLLRSVVVDPGARSAGVGRRLCTRAIDAARVEGRTQLYLLTTSAAGFFSELGFSEIPRDQAPLAIRETREFSTICPGDATLMFRSLDEDRSAR